MQAVEDLCLHKMASDLYSKLREVGSKRLRCSLMITDALKWTYNCFVDHICS